MRVLVLEDDPELGPAVASGLRDAGFAVDLATDLADADLKLAVSSYDCWVADRGLPDGDGVDERVAGFDHGADDYLVEPFAMAELVVRVRALCRRGLAARPPVLVHGDLRRWSASPLSNPRAVF
jgi:DNA-binding response OmpR family regulator